MSGSGSFSLARSVAALFHLQTAPEAVRKTGHDKHCLRYARARRGQECFQASPSQNRCILSFP